MRHRRRTAAMSVVVLVGCASESAEDLLLDADSVASLTLAEELRIGSLDDPEIGFSRIDEVDVDRDGRIYVFETLPPEIRVYSASGEFLHRIGGPGQGPGEFQGPRFSFGVHGDTVWVIDPLRASRITLFTRAGEVLSTGAIRSPVVPLGRPGESAALVPFEMDAEGLFTSEVGSMSVSEPPSGEMRVQGPGATQVPRIRFDASGSVVDTVGWGRASMDTSPGSATMWWLRLADGELDVHELPSDQSGQGVFRIVRTSALGDTIGSQSFRYTRVAADSTDGYLKPVTFARVGSDGMVWLRRDDRADDEESRWLVLNSELEPVGQVILPRSGFRVEWSREDVMLAVEADELGVPWIVKYRVGR